MGKFHVYKLGLTITFYAVFYATQNIVNCSSIDDDLSNSRQKRESANDLIFYQGANGIPGRDFPILAYIPRTSFSCKTVDSGYYADLDTDCQVFHICDEGRKMSFLCPNGTIFEQSELICEWWFKVNCSNSPSLYQESAEILQRENAKRKEGRRVSSYTGGTKQGAFPDSSELFTSGTTGEGAGYRTPARFVTSSYLYSTASPAYSRNNIEQSQDSRTERKFKGFGSRNIVVTNGISTTSASEIKKTQEVSPVRFSFKSQNVVEPEENKNLHNKQYQDEQETITEHLEGASATYNFGKPFPYRGNSNYNSISSSPSSSTFPPFDFSKFQRHPTKVEGDDQLLKRIPMGFTHNENSRKNNVPYSSFRFGSAFDSSSSTAKFTATTQRTTTSSEEAQEPQESSSFIKTSFNNIQNGAKSTLSNNPPPNHRDTYSEIKDSRYYYPKPQHTLPEKPFVGSSVDSKILSTIPVSTPKEIVSSITSTTEFGDGNKTSTEIPIIGLGPFSAIRVISKPKEKSDFSTESPKENGPIRISVLKPETSVSDRILTNNFDLSTAGDENRKGKSFSENPKEKSADKITLEVSNNNQFKGTVRLTNKQYNDQFSTENYSYKPTKFTSDTSNRLESSSFSKDRKEAVTQNPVGSTDSTRQDNRYLPTGPPKKDFTIQDNQNLPIEPPRLDEENASPRIDGRPIGPFEETVSDFRTSPYSPTGTSTIPTTLDTDRSTQEPSTITTTKFESTTPLSIEVYPESTETNPTGSTAENDLLIVSQTSSIMQPKPFELPTTEEFTTDVNREGKALIFRTLNPNPTQPTPFTTENPIYSDKGIDDNINNMIITLMEMAKKRLEQTSGEFPSSRPGLLVPPSAGPETLHTLARYFASALESATITPIDDNASDKEIDAREFGNDALIRALLSQMTIEKYEDLFRESTSSDVDVTTQSTTLDSFENDLERQDSSRPQNPPVRQLARVFTEALAVYLQDPETFKKVLQEVRPTEPPESTIKEETVTAEDELLSFSDQDLSSNQPRLPLPTGLPLVTPTWGYIVALNKSEEDNVESGNSIQKENLQGADSQSLVSHLNKLSGALQKTDVTTEFVTEEPKATLPENHWTKSPDLTQFLQTTLSLNPTTFNDNFGTTGGLSSGEINQSTESDEDITATSSELPGVTDIKYELRALPKLEYNSSEVHGILLDFMSANNTEGMEKLQRVLNKMNITQEQFLEKMKEIEANPITRRLILLLISECSTDKGKELDKKVSSGENLLGNLKSQNEALHTASSSSIVSQNPINRESKSSNHFKDIVDPSLGDNDEDTRALQLLNSLYVIASKFGK